MPNCEMLEKCIFFNDKMANMDIWYVQPWGEKRCRPTSSPIRGIRPGRSLPRVNSNLSAVYP